MAKLMHKDESYTGGGAEIDDTTTSTEKVWSSDKTNNAILGNIFPNRAVSQTVSGVTFTVNADKTITANGTYESQAPYLLSDGWGSTNVEWIKPFEGKTVCISGSIVGVTFSIKFYDENNVVTAIETGYDGDEKVGVIPTNIAKYEAYLFNSGLYALTDVVFKPMLRLTTELMRYTDNAVLGAKNLNSYPYIDTSKTTSGITFTDNGDGTVTVSSGTASARAVFNYHTRGISGANKLIVKNGQYIVTGCPSGGSLSTYHTTIGITKNSAYYSLGDDSGAGATITINGDDFSNDDVHLQMQIAIEQNTVISAPMTFKPMLRLATDKDSTYQPFSLTNQQLTQRMENVQSIDLSSIVTASAPLFEIVYAGVVLRNGIAVLSLRVKCLMDVVSATGYAVVTGLPYIPLGFDNKNIECIGRNITQDNIGVMAWFSGSTHGRLDTTGGTMAGTLLAEDDIISFTAIYPYVVNS